MSVDKATKTFLICLSGENIEMRAPNADEPGGAADGGAALLVGDARHAVGRHPGEDADQEHRAPPPGTAGSVLQQVLKVKVNIIVNIHAMYRYFLCLRRGLFPALNSSLSIRIWLF